MAVVIKKACSMTIFIGLEIHASNDHSFVPLMLSFKTNEISFGYS